jgi:MoaA/NifB/PqqE/SkfB family radical SAM enzyme
MTTQQWCAAIDKLRAAGVPMLTFTGGEPTEREDIVELVGYAKWFVTRLNTNGINVTSELASALREASLDSMQITFYSSDKNIHNTLVGGDHYDATVAGIKNAVAAGLDVSVNTPLCKKNADYTATLDFVRGLGVRFVTASGLICTGAAGVNHEDYDLTSEELYEIIKRAREFTLKAEMEMDFTSPGLIPKEKLKELNMNVPSCGAALSNMAIAPDGTVVPCQSWLTEGAGLGNILKDPFKKIWAHPIAKKLRRMTDKEALACPFRAEKGVGRV